MTVRLLEEPDESLPAYQPIRAPNGERPMIWEKRHRVGRSGTTFRRSACPSCGSGRG